MARETIDVQTFMCNLGRHLDNPLPGGLETKTRFRDLPDWTSLQALIVVASFEWDYGVTISADEFWEADTIQGLYDLVVQKMGQ